MENKEFKKAILQYGELFIEEITKQLLLNNKKATGNLIDSLDYKVIEVADEITLQIIANPYLTVVDKGLKKGTFPNVKNLARWIDARGIKSAKYKTNAQLSWAIATEIKEKGIKPSNVLKKAKASFLSNKKALNNVVDAAKIDVNALIKEALKNLNK